MTPQQELIPEVINKGLSGITDYVMPIVAVLAIMAVFGLRIVLISGPNTKNYIYHIIIITIVLMGLGVVLKLIPEYISELIITSIATVIFVLFTIQLIIQIKLKKNK